MFRAVSIVAPDHCHVLAIGVVIDRIGLGLAHHAAVDHIDRRGHTDLGDPRPSSSEQKYSSPRQDMPGGTISGGP